MILVGVGLGGFTIQKKETYDIIVTSVIYTVTLLCTVPHSHIERKNFFFSQLMWPLCLLGISVLSDTVYTVVSLQELPIKSQGLRGKLLIFDICGASPLN